jgi:hypothetical protein
VVGVKEKEGFPVISVENSNLPCYVYLRDDCYEDAMRSRHGILEVKRDLEAEGIMVDGRHHFVQSCMGGDLKLLNGCMGLCGCSSKYTCMYCKAKKEHMFMTKSAWDGFGELPIQTVQEMAQMAHAVSDFDYVSPAPGAFIRACACIYTLLHKTPDNISHFGKKKCNHA